MDNNIPNQTNDISWKSIVEQLKKNSDKQHKDFIAGAALNRKELNDLEEGILRLNKNLEKLTKIISSSTVLEKANTINSKGISRTSGTSVNVVTNPEMKRSMREGNRPVNIGDVFSNFINKDSRSPDNYFFQSNKEARQREELRIQLKKGEINQQDYDEQNEKIGKSGGFKDFFKDFKEGLVDVKNFFTNKNVVQSEQSKASVSEGIDKTNIDQVQKTDNVLLNEVTTIRKILENNFKKTKPSADRKNKERPASSNDITIYKPKQTTNRKLIGDSSRIIDVQAKEVKSKPLLLGSSGQNQIQSAPAASVPMLLAPSKSADVIDVEAKPVEEAKPGISVGDISIGGGIANAAKAGSKLGGFLKGAGRVLGKAALPLAAATAAYEGFTGYNEAADNLDIKDREATFGEKLSSAGGNIVSGLTFGLIDKKDASKGIANFFGAGADKKDSQPSKSETKDTFIANEPVIKDKPLSEKQLAAMKMSMDMGNTYSPEIMAKYKEQTMLQPIKKSEEVTPLSEENQALKGQNTQANNTTVINNNNNQTQAPAQSAVGSAPATRPEQSSLEKYLDRQSVYA